MLSDDDDCFIDRSPSPPTEVTTANMLEEFREKWKKQIFSGNEILNENENENSSTNGGSGGGVGTSSSITNSVTDTNDNDGDDDDETRAKQYFQKASELENLGKVFEAMHLYRRAVQICPDIEFKMYEITKISNKNDENDNKKKSNNKLNNDNLNGNTNENVVKKSVNHGDDDDEDDDDDDDDNLEDVDLLARFQTAISRTGRLFQRGNQLTSSNVDTIHLSNLPMEIILYILKWVVSNDLDLRSLDQLSFVSKGFYICAKDQEIWRLACHKIWGVHVGTLKQSTYLSWREMYLERHRVHFNGCYISRTSYFRYGEHNFQDQFYRPIHLIEYFRYIRFFPDGNALMMTTPDEPNQIVTKLKTRSFTIPRSDVLKGNYRLHGDTIALIMKRTIAKPVQLNNNNRQYRRNLVDGNDDGGNFEKNHTFLLEFQIGTATKRKFNQLKWKNYSMIQTTKKNEELTTDFDLKPSMYPPLIFSRVKSYNLVSEMPLI